MHADLADAFTPELRGFVASASTRRALPTSCHVGHPAGAQVALPDVADQGLRADLVERAIDGLDTDRARLCVAHARWGAGHDRRGPGVAGGRTSGFARHGLVLPAFFVLTRTAGSTWSPTSSALDAGCAPGGGPRDPQSGQVCTGSLACIRSR